MHSVERKPTDTGLGPVIRITQNAGKETPWEDNGGHSASNIFVCWNKIYPNVVFWCLEHKRRLGSIFGDLDGLFIVRLDPLTAN
jgi:hypothetical protein